MQSPGAKANQQEGEEKEGGLKAKGKEGEIEKGVRALDMRENRGDNKSFLAKCRKLYLPRTGDYDEEGWKEKGPPKGGVRRKEKNIEPEKVGKKGGFQKQLGITWEQEKLRTQY